MTTLRDLLKEFSSSDYIKELEEALVERSKLDTYISDHERRVTDLIYLAKYLTKAFSKHDHDNKDEIILEVSGYHVMGHKKTDTGSTTPIYIFQTPLKTLFEHKILIRSTNEYHATILASILWTMALNGLSVDFGEWYRNEYKSGRVDHIFIDINSKNTVYQEDYQNHCLDKIV
jgi:hypothetical protein